MEKKLLTVDDLIIPALLKDGRLEGDLSLWVSNVQLELDKIDGIENKTVAPYWYLITLKNELTRVLRHINYKEESKNDEDAE